MKQAYEKVYDMYGYSFQKVETTGKCKKITGGVEEEETHYVQVQRKLFGIPVWKTWIPSENIKWCEPVVETIREIKSSEPLEIYDDFDDSLIEFWHSDEIRPFVKVRADELRICLDYAEVYSRDYSYPILVINGYDFWREVSE